jgi:hypothetical protein
VIGENTGDANPDGFVVGNVNSPDVEFNTLARAAFVSGVAQLGRDR